MTRITDKDGSKTLRMISPDVIHEVHARMHAKPSPAPMITLRLISGMPCPKCKATKPMIDLGLKAFYDYGCVACGAYFRADGTVTGQMTDEIRDCIQIDVETG